MSACLLALVIACGGERDAATLGSQASEPPSRRAVLGEFLDLHWRLPVPAQGSPPPGFSDAEASLDPATCGACHPEQHAEWRTSLHAAAFSPGFAGQLLEGPLAAPAELRTCQTCHAPLAEQQPVAADGRPSAHYDAELRAQGLVCAACHVREHRRYGPPRRADAPRPADPVPHAGFQARAEFQESRFCAPCHQFFDDPGVNGKPLENTWVEWRASPQAAAGRTCQSCHMPDRAHLWRGIHDPAMVREAVDVELVPQAPAQGSLRAHLVLHNRDVGHRFPTYVTPRVFLAVWQEDAAGREIEGSRREATVGRAIDFQASPWRERFDTRVAPGESVKLVYAVPREPAARALVGRVTVDPDHHYRGVFEALAASYTDAHARRLASEAWQRTRTSSYVLAERRLALSDP